MQLAYAAYPFSPILGWSISRYEVFDKCKRQYFYTYYSKHGPVVPHYKMAQLRDLTSVPLEIGNVVHDVLEAFLKRLQKSDSDIDEQRFFLYARQKAG
jgi:ATP-dependent helicase/DNAse subunit B